MLIIFMAALAALAGSRWYLLVHSEKHVRGHARKYHLTMRNFMAGVVFLSAGFILAWLTSQYVRTHKEAIALLIGAFVGSFLIEWGLLPWLMRNIRVGEAQQIGTVERPEDHEA